MIQNSFSNLEKSCRELHECSKNHTLPLYEFILRIRIFQNENHLMVKLIHYHVIMSFEIRKKNSCQLIKNCNVVNNSLISITTQLIIH